jgi:Flp pilus assembly protein TadG
LKGTTEEPGADDHDGSIVPFLAAAAVFVVVVVGVLVFTLTRGDGLTEEQRVARAAVGQNDALQRQNYADYQRYTCTQAQGLQPEVLAAQRDSNQKQGARFVDDVSNVKVDGDHATATVTYHFTNARDPKRTTDLTFARQDGTWKVCSAYK